jgi:ferredoxin
MDKRIIFCNCRGKIVDSQWLESTVNDLQNSNQQVIKLTDLCGLCVSDKEEVNKIFTEVGEMLVVACYYRAVKLLLKSINADIESNRFTFLNFRNAKDTDLREEITSFYSENPSESSFNELKSEQEWPSWFPVIDGSRCTSCGQCADFCLFGVYEKKDNKVSVVNPKGCKNNCPACARICPQTAIVFPKYAQGGAIAGDDSIDEIAEQKRRLTDVNDILGSDIYKTLEQRKLKRKSIVKEEAIKKAMKEREKALNEQ